MNQPRMPSQQQVEVIVVEAMLDHFNANRTAFINPDYQTMLGMFRCAGDAMRSVFESMGPMPGMMPPPGPMSPRQ